MPAIARGGGGTSTLPFPHVTSQIWDPNARSVLVSFLRGLFTFIKKLGGGPALVDSGDGPTARVSLEVNRDRPAV